MSIVEVSTMLMQCMHLCIDDSEVDLCMHDSYKLLSLIYIRSSKFSTKLCLRPVNIIQL